MRWVRLCNACKGLRISYIHFYYFAEYKITRMNIEIMSLSFIIYLFITDIINVLNPFTPTTLNACSTLSLLSLSSRLQTSLTMLSRFFLFYSFTHIPIICLPLLSKSFYCRSSPISTFTFHQGRKKSDDVVWKMKYLSTYRRVFTSRSQNIALSVGLSRRCQIEAALSLRRPLSGLSYNSCCKGSIMFEMTQTWRERLPSLVINERKRAVQLTISCKVTVRCLLGYCAV
jgi:hypothetical protein